jgi:hypothetical protein
MVMRGAVKIAVLGVVALLFLWRPAVTQGNMDDAAKALFDSANHERTSRGIPALKWDASLAEAAHQHAVRMAQQNTLSHQFPGEPDVPTREAQAGEKMSAAAENVALGPSAAVIHTGWMHSPPHRHNLLDPQMNSVGIAVVQRGDMLFAVEDFSRALAMLSLDEQEKIVAVPVRASNLKIRADNSDARRVCEIGSAASAQAALTVQFSTAGLSTLPAALEHAIHSGKYVSAEIGACTKSSSDGLSQYHIAVLLY